MIDYTELKRLAEALEGAEWVLVDGDGFEEDNRFVTSQRRLDDDKVAFAEINYGHPDAGMAEPFQSQQVVAGEFIAAANPAVVLALIAENERLVPFEEAYATACNVRNRLIKDNELQDRLIVENKALSDSFRAERDQLRAEIAGLKTGYEAYERVNAELRAEVEALRSEREDKVLCDLELFETLRDSASTEAEEHRQCMATYRPLRQANMDSVVKKCDDLLAAMGQGERS